MGSTKRKEIDVINLMMSNYKVEIIKDTMDDLILDFFGPPNSLYEGGHWKIHIEIPTDYPYKFPSIRFENKIFHPNINEETGRICLDVLNQTWSPMFDLRNIFDSFIPQLLMYPNPLSYLNMEAASLLLKNPENYNKKVKEMVKKYSIKPNEELSEISLDGLSDLSDTSDLDPELL
ncbi:unnamed protein product [Blepharisma stoltei]|uniref:Ubiquitin-conjugating enzyme E2 H n=1 Tax=Blepharisma stoltei TaxID=1481888 RepID=A0AAU9IY94_9CILI|nr:unnamed protein product [Blepharisma stoltei]